MSQPLPPDHDDAAPDPQSGKESGSLWRDQGSQKSQPAHEPLAEQDQEPETGSLFNKMLGRKDQPPVTPQAEPTPAPKPAAAAPVPEPLPAVTPVAADAAIVAPKPVAPPAAAAVVTAPHTIAPKPRSTEPIVRLVDVHKSFDSHVVLDGVSMDIYPGQATVIIGPSGTGKSVLLKHIAGLLKPDRGEIWFRGQRIDNLSEKKLVETRKHLGMLFQMGALFDSMNVGENIMFPLVEHDRSMTPQQRLIKCQKMLGIVGLSGVENKMPSDLSGGQKKRVALARAIILEPELVLYDEPTTGLDPIRADVINELILGLTRALGITSIVVTHDMASANKIADRMVMLYDGKIIIDGSPSDFHQTDNDLVKRFILGQADREELEAIRKGIEPVIHH